MVLIVVSISCFCHFYCDVFIIFIILLCFSFTWLVYRRSETRKASPSGALVVNPGRTASATAFVDTFGTRKLDWCNSEVVRPWRRCTILWFRFYPAANYWYKHPRLSSILLYILLPLLWGPAVVMGSADVSWRIGSALSTPCASLLLTRMSRFDVTSEHPQPIRPSRRRTAVCFLPATFAIARCPRGPPRRPPVSLPTDVFVLSGLM